jgi:exopolysaccharide biosynthesis protein
MGLKSISSFLLIIYSFVIFAQEKINSPVYQLIEKENHQIHLIDIDPSQFKIMLVRATDEEQGRKVVSSFVEQNKALIGINAGYFYVNKGIAKPSGALKINHQWLGYQSRARGAIGWNDDNTVRVDRITAKKINLNTAAKVKVQPLLDTSDISEKQWQEFSYIVGGIPVLIQHGKIINDVTPERAIKSFIEERHARTAVCIKDNHHWLILVASHTKEPDRPFASVIVEGLTIPELTQFLHKQGCKDAINLDGGGSSTLVMDGKVINYPAGDMDEFLHFYHERPVSDAIIISPI